MATRSQSIFPTIRTEGGLLPADLLKRIADGDKGLDGLTPESYHLDPGRRLNEATNQAWSACRDAWQRFAKQRTELAESETGTTLTRERWLLILFRELGYGRLQATPAITVDDKSYPISHGWGHAPIHLVSFRYDLDRSIPGVARVSPHSLVQELLNRSDARFWGFVSNGLVLRILRDNISFTRPAYVEFDLEAMFAGEVYSDFVLLWLLCHQSRVESDRPEQCWLEKWHQAAKQQGTRALDRLRDGVQNAIEAFGQGFLAHRANTILREKLAAGTLTTQEYYQQVLRLVYRLIFLFVAEDRDLLLLRDADPAARRRYEQYYTLIRIRRLAERRRGTRHADLWQGIRLVFRHLYRGEPRLALPALGSMLFSYRTMPDLDDCELANDALLTAVRHLAFTQDRNVLRGVDFKNLGSEELGSVYESLLELHPQINATAATFSLASAAGSERKTTGSYYTPTSLINCLLDSALDPVVEDRLKGKSGTVAEQTLLALKVCDPACGSGHFLIAAANRLAHRLARIRTGDDEPSPTARRAAFRDVVSHCIYGVDINPMAVELCKVALWLESIDPGRPLSFLDHRILCGNSLLGTTPRLLREGIPDAAFEPIEGDDKAVSREYKRRNRDERVGQGIFDFGALPSIKLGNLVETYANLAALDDDSLEDLETKERRYAEFVQSAGYESARLLADAWCAAFVWKKTRDLGDAITQAVFHRIERNPHDLVPWMRAEIRRLADQYRFFHWHLAFPDVFRMPGPDEEPENEHAGWSGGFDLMLGNPPWDTLSPDAKEFFSGYNPQIRFQDKEGQERIISELLADSGTRKRWDDYCRDLYALVHFLKNCGRFRLYAPGNLGKGDFNVFRMFVETSLEFCADNCWAAQVVPEGLYNGANCMAIRKELFERFELRHLFCFENTREVWFQNVDTRAKFCIYAARKHGCTESFRAAFNIHTEVALAEAVAGQSIAIPVAIVREFSPNALAVAELTSQLEIGIASKMYSRCPKFGDASAGPPIREYMREIDMGNDRELFGESPEGLPLYEGRMVWHYDHRAKGYRSGRGRKADWEELCFDDPNKSIQPQWNIPIERIPPKTRDRIAHYRVGFCDVASPTNERALVAAIIPPNCICGDKVPTVMFGECGVWACCLWVAVANTFTMDFLARTKISLKMSYTVLDSLPFPRPASESPLARALVPRVLMLTCTSHEMIPLWQHMACEGWVPPITASDSIPGVLDEDVRLRLQAEIEAIVARHVFGLSRTDLEYILETFPIVKRRDEARHGSYHTKDTILAAYDGMEEIHPIELPPEQLAVRRATPLPARIAPELPAAPGILPGFENAVAAIASESRRREREKELVLQAFRDVRDGRSPDYVIAAPELNPQFLARARDLGVASPDVDVNLMLYGARKASKLRNDPTTREYHLPKAVQPFVFASEWAIRHLQRELLAAANHEPSLDDILCNPVLIQRFDTVAARIKPGFSPLEYRWAALGLRKQGRKQPAPAIVDFPLNVQLKLFDLDPADVPPAPGLYLIQAEDRPLYVNATDNLREQVRRHYESAGKLLVPDWLTTARGSPTHLSFAAVKVPLPKLKEARIARVAALQPWLNLLDLTGAA